jgi:hypothetical protein
VPTLRFADELRGVCFSPHQLRGRDPIILFVFSGVA